MKQVTLFWYEVEYAAMVGIKRQIRSRSSKDHNKIQSKDFGWHTDIESACAELAVAKALNLYWDGSINVSKRPDIPSGLQIRHTSFDSGHLIVRPGDPLEHRYILVTGTSPLYCLRGWLWGYEVKSIGDWRKHINCDGYAWWVSQEKLNPIITLEDSLLEDIGKCEPMTSTTP